MVDLSTEGKVIIFKFVCADEDGDTDAENETDLKISGGLDLNKYEYYINDIYYLMLHIL